MVKQPSPHLNVDIILNKVEALYTYCWIIVIHLVIFDVFLPLTMTDWRSSKLEHFVLHTCCIFLRAMKAIYSPGPNLPLQMSEGGSGESCPSQPRCYTYTHTHTCSAFVAVAACTCGAVALWFLQSSSSQEAVRCRQPLTLLHIRSSNIMWGVVSMTETSGLSLFQHKFCNITEINRHPATTKKKLSWMQI